MHINSGAYRKISREEWEELGGDGNKFCDWHEGAGYVVYDGRALKEFQDRVSPPGLLEAAAKLLDAIDELKSKTRLERIVTGRSDADLRKDSEEAIMGMRAAISKAKATA